MRSITTAWLLFLCSLFYTLSSNAQDSSHIRISLLTCAPGDELYSTFGHSALRITDTSSLTDMVFNYGTFDFSDPNFYGKFVRGKLLYFLSVDNFQDFRADYQADNRGITEQVLCLSAEEKIELERALYDNLKEENRFYKYDFFFDNCTSRLRDLLIRYKKDMPPLKAAMPAGTTFRQAIHLYLDSNKKYWGELAIDLLLGARTDAVMTAQQAAFLPNNLMYSLDSVPGLVSHKQSLYPVVAAQDEYNWFTPLFLFSFIFIIILLLGFSRNKLVKGFLRIFDGLLFFSTGLTGMLLIFMWAATNHTMCADNFNLLWAWPTNAIVASFSIYKRTWTRIYFGFMAVALTILLAAWFFLPEQLNNAFIPLVLLLITRSIYQYIEPAKTVRL